MADVPQFGVPREWIARGNPQVADLADQYADQYGVPRQLYYNLLWRENGTGSGDNAQLTPRTSGAGAFGYTQFIPSTANSYGVQPGDLASQLEGGAHYLHDMAWNIGPSAQWSGNPNQFTAPDWGRAVGGYIAGPRRYDQWSAGQSAPAFGNVSQSYVLNVLRDVPGYDINSLPERFRNLPGFSRFLPGSNTLGIGSDYAANANLSSAETLAAQRAFHPLTQEQAGWVGGNPATAPDLVNTGSEWGYYGDSPDIWQTIHPDPPPPPTAPDPWGSPISADPWGTGGTGNPGGLGNPNVWGALGGAPAGTGGTGEPIGLGYTGFPYGLGGLADQNIWGGTGGAGAVGTGTPDYGVGGLANPNIWGGSGTSPPPSGGPNWNLIGALDPNVPGLYGAGGIFGTGGISGGVAGSFTPDPNNFGGFGGVGTGIGSAGWDSPGVTNWTMPGGSAGDAGIYGSGGSEYVGGGGIGGDTLGGGGSGLGATPGGSIYVQPWYTPPPIMNQPPAGGPSIPSIIPAGWNLSGTGTLSPTYNPILGF